MWVRNRFYVVVAVAGCCFGPVQAQVTPTAPQPGSTQVTEEMINGVKHQVTRQTVEQRVPVTIMQDRQQTVYAPKISTETIAHQQVYSVPVTQYEVVPVLHGRWNPFVEPYYTYETQLVTRYQEQVVNVQIPVSKSEWVTETKTVQVPVTEYRTAQQEIVTKVALTGGESTKTYASTQPSLPQPVTMKPYNSQPASSIATQPATPLPNYAQAQPSYGYSQPPYNSTPATSSPANVASRPSNQSAIGGQMLQTDPPRQGTGWSNLPAGYR
jgi:hypothetical protein